MVGSELQEPDLPLSDFPFTGDTTHFVRRIRCSWSNDSLRQVADVAEAHFGRLSLFMLLDKHSKEKLRVRF